MNSFLTLIVASISLTGMVANAEVVFYKRNTRIANVNCETNELTIKNIYRTTMNIRKDYDKEKFGDICAKLAHFAESNQAASLTGHAKAITLLTVEKTSIGDSIVDEEVIGVLDIDNINAVLPAIERDPVYTQFCSQLDSGTRSTAEMCLHRSNAGLYFLEFKSVQSYLLSKTTVVSSTDGKLSLASKDSDGKVEITVSGAMSADGKSFKGEVTFENRLPMSVLLNKK